MRFFLTVARFARAQWLAHGGERLFSQWRGSHGE